MSRSNTYTNRNRFILNQRGGTVLINNSSGRESVKVSHYSGSNIAITNFVTSELATANKQTYVIDDEFRSVGGHHCVSIGGDNNVRVGENQVNFIGFQPNKFGLNEQMTIGVHYRWRELYRPVSHMNSEWDLKRGGYSMPNGVPTPLAGDRAPNPDLKFNGRALDNRTTQLNGVPIRNSRVNEVWFYTRVPNREQQWAKSVSPNSQDIKQAFGRYGTYAPGIKKFGPDKSSATEGGTWVENLEDKNSRMEILLRRLYMCTNDPGDAELDKSKCLFPLEARMGYGGDLISTVKRNQVETIGVVTNNYPSIKIDEYGRSQPTEVGVSETRVIKHHDYVPLIEDSSNDENFPGGVYTLTVGNKYEAMVGSGGIQMFTSGSMMFSSMKMQAACTQIDFNASHGIILGSPSHIDIYSPKIHFRSRRQILADSSLGITHNAVIGGGAYIEGELYTHHITAPLEIQQTESTEAWGYLPWPRHCGWAYMDPGTVIGTFSTSIQTFDAEGEPTTVSVSGVVRGSGAYVKVFGSNQHDTVRLYPHEHHFHNLPLRLTESNKALRNYAQREGINTSTYSTTALRMDHRRKTPWRDPGPRV